MRRNEYAPRQRAKLVREFGGACKGCGAREGLDFAHVKDTKLGGWGRGRKERLADVGKHRGCYVLLCHDTCHRALTAWEKEHERLAGSREAAVLAVKEFLARGAAGG